MAKVSKSDAEWREQLTPEQYAVLRRAGTERAGSGEYAHCKDEGVYHCAGCGAPLFRSDTKYESGTGWPSFWEPVAAGAVAERDDSSHGMLRREVLCATCDGHLGHVFPDGPKPSGRRYCMNSLAIRLERGGAKK
ncbi:MAG: peptide-methionine (R)-S-oxide reductase MsrB [Myxococcota bacterium]